MANTRAKLKQADITRAAKGIQAASTKTAKEMAKNSLAVWNVWLVPSKFNEHA